MNDRQLRYALAIWNERSFSRAAAKLGVSQPSLSEQIRLFEEELGFKLFYRNSRGVEASANGHAFLEGAAGVVSGLTALKDLARELGGKPGASLRIGLNSGLGQSMIGRIFRTLERGKIKLNIELVTATNRRILRLLHQDRLDFGLVLESDIRPTVDQAPPIEIAHTDIVLLVPSGHPLAGARSCDLGDVVRHPLIVNEPRIGYCRAVLSLLAEKGLAPVIAADCDNIEALKYLARAGAGVGVAPRIAAEAELERGLLRAAPVEGLPRAAIQLVRRREPLTPRLERIFAQFGKDLAEPLPTARSA